MLLTILILTILFVFPSLGAEILGIGGTSSSGLLQDWFYAYSSIKPDVQLKYNFSSPRAGIDSVMLNTPSYSDWGMIESLRPTAADALTNPNFQMFPLVAGGSWIQVNIDAIKNSSLHLNLTRSVVADIFMGNITKWNDIRILDANPQLKSLLINVTNNITVFYSGTPGSQHLMWSTLLSSFSDVWNRTYGIKNFFPPQLAALPNFKASNSTLLINAGILYFPYSIGFSTAANIVRDQAIQYVCLINVLDEVICPGLSQSVAMSATDIAQGLLNNSLLTNGAFAIDEPLPGAYPLASYLSVVVSTNPPVERCTETFEFYKFLKWIYTDKGSQDQAIRTGWAPLPPPLVQQIMSILSKIKCGGRSVYEITVTNSRGPLSIFLLTATSLILLLVFLLSALHLQDFRTYVNLVYSIVFIVGAVITLISPFVWYLIPTKDSVCQGRVWLTSIGLSILFGTVFSRTYQLKDIYDLQKRGGALKAFKQNITIRSSLQKLALTLLLVICTNLLIMTIWTVTDPFRSNFQVTDDLNLEGEWMCTSTHLQTWLILELIFLGGLLWFGVYVIYYTWSFQRETLVAETRGVLIALYNVILNLTAVIPIAYLSLRDDDAISTAMMISILFSGGGIVLAFLLPRTLKKIFGQSSKESGTYVSAKETIPDKDTITEKTPRGPARVAEKTKEVSRTPPMELSLRLEKPAANYRRYSQGEAEKRQEIELLEAKKTTGIEEETVGEPSPRGKGRQTPVDDALLSSSVSGYTPHGNGLDSPHKDSSTQLNWSSNPLNGNLET